MTLTAILYILFVHWIADFVLQTDRQAKNKSKNNVALTRHVGTYTLTLFMTMWPWFFTMYTPTMTLFAPTGWLITWVAANGILHFATDYVTSRVNTYLWNKGDVHNFFVMVGFDQLIHYACLFGTYTYFAS